jgi:predicted alpha/beta-fold hydrolase
MAKTMHGFEGSSNVRGTQLNTSKNRCGFGAMVIHWTGISGEVCHGEGSWIV